MTTHVLVIGGGQNAEHDVSLASAAAVAAALGMSGHVVSTVTIDRSGIWRADGIPPCVSPAESLVRAMPLIARADVVFPAVHGALGEDGALAALCALAGARVVGSGLRAGALGMDKWATKLVADAVGIRTARGRLIAAEDAGDAEFDGEVVVKPVSAGSSYGVSLVRQEGELLAALHTAAKFDRRILVEEVVRGREIDVAVLRESGGVRWAAPPLEIHATGLFDTAMKYDGSARFTVPAQLDAAETSALKRAAVAMFDALGCAGVARMDFFLTDDGPVLNEVNTMPGLTAASQVPRMFAAAGVEYTDLVTRLVRAAR
ncbi:MULTISPECIES: D-alanine--D-alanine ligase [unclassified Microbacterium]|uniref:D-alanine--D-alanine ligase family protein n=1 Tax=unclassified Microbacterium TaxID=2609290 RepID=UPI000EA9F553|nr:MULTISPECIES: D-alanine--D-alanine ligase [unclassified Microbacterium]MBT2484353.1 D-alanine--D-alanine ligase [Microbacterium sp. ISL-108]RKN67267.1 D-alanine--D-alanine ligase [Microbacterium sp. CGR2]